MLFWTLKANFIFHFFPSNLIATVEWFNEYEYKLHIYSWWYETFHSNSIEIRFYAHFIINNFCGCLYQFYEIIDFHSVQIKLNNFFFISTKSVLLNKWFDWVFKIRAIYCSLVEPFELKVEPIALWVVVEYWRSFHVFDTSIICSAHCENVNRVNDDEGKKSLSVKLIA